MGKELKDSERTTVAPKTAEKIIIGKTPGQTRNYITDKIRQEAEEGLSQVTERIKKRDQVREITSAFTGLFVSIEESLKETKFDDLKNNLQKDVSENFNKEIFKLFGIEENRMTDELRRQIAQKKLDSQMQVYYNREAPIEIDVTAGTGKSFERGQFINLDEEFADHYDEIVETLEKEKKPRRGLTPVEIEILQGQMTLQKQNDEAGKPDPLIEKIQRAKITPVKDSPRVKTAKKKVAKKKATKKKTTKKTTRKKK